MLEDKPKVGRPFMDGERKDINLTFRLKTENKDNLDVFISKHEGLTVTALLTDFINLVTVKRLTTKKVMDFVQGVRKFERVK